MIIGKTEIKKGTKEVVKLPVGSLPSGTRIYITAHVFRSKKEGPTGLILAGVHGDEINGIEIVRRSLYEGLYDRLICGTMIVIPLLNIFGFINFSREVPDGKDVNRSFPGNIKGSLAARVARTLTKQILPHVDFGVDFHTGGASRYNFPQTRFYKEDEGAQKLALNFGAPMTIEKPLIAKSLRKAAYDMDIPVVVYEGGESVRLDGRVIEVGVKGIENILKYKEMLIGSDMDIIVGEVIKKTSWLRSPRSGIFIWSKSSGTMVKKGDILGTIGDPSGIKLTKVLAHLNGVIVGHNNASVVNQGDALFNIGY